MKLIDKEGNPQLLREQYIRILDSSNNPTNIARLIADDLFALDLTVYSKNYTLDSILYSSFAISTLDENISLHPEQIEIINNIKENDAIIVSAPTSFGKTFCIFEYIATFKPKNVVLIVPTLALIDEYVKKIVKNYDFIFKRYKVHTQLSEETEYNFNNYNVFILTHDRVVNESSYSLIKEIDFLVIDEVYKLETDKEDDRVLVLNMAYYYLAKKAKKYVLLAPFIKSVDDIDKLDKKPKFYNTNYSPVINDVKVIDILRHEDRYSECQRILNNIDKTEKTLIYFPTVTGIYNYVNNYILNEPVINYSNSYIQSFVEWAKEEIHDEWCVIKAMERGYLIHNGQIPIGTRLFQLDYYEESEIYNRLLCTSTLLEGVNTTAKNIIITKPSRKSDKNNRDNFTAFDFFNLVGRTGRLYKHFIGNAYYIKAPGDPEYRHKDAIKSVKFELTDDSIDIDIQQGYIDNHTEVIDFLNEMGINIDDYMNNIGSKLRFDTVKKMFIRYKEKRKDLIEQLTMFINNARQGRLDLVKVLYYIVEGENNSFRSNILNSLLNKSRPKIKTVVNNTSKFFSKTPLDIIISTAIYIKMSYIEYQFYTKVTVIKFFMQIDDLNISLINILEGKIINTIDYLYFSSSKQKRMLLDLGIYERDVEKIIGIIGDDYDDTFELKQRLYRMNDKIKNISFLSKYIISKMFNN